MEPTGLRWWRAAIIEVVVLRVRGRVVVGLEHSLAGFAALRHAADIAGRAAAPLYVVLARRTRLGGIGFRPVLAGRTVDVVEDRREVRAAFLDAMGDVPAGLDVHVAAVAGSLASNLVALADRDDDLIIVGGASPERRLPRRTGSVLSRTCLRRARCPVLVVPPPCMARTIRSRTWTRPT